MKPAARPAAATKVKKVAQSPAAVQKKTKPSRQQRTSKPEQSTRLLPWRQDGITEVAHVRVRHIAIYRSPRAKHASLVLGKRDANGTPRTFLVRATKGGWVRVFLPTRPNGSQGWVKRRAVRMYTNGYRLVVRLRSNELRLWRGDRLLARYPVALGTRSTPTPRGLYYIVELLQPRTGRRFVRAVLVRAVGALERAEAFRRRRRPCRPARDEPAGADRLRRQSRLHPAAERRGATTRENPAARYARLHPHVAASRYGTVSDTGRCLSWSRAFVAQCGLASYLWNVRHASSGCLTPGRGSVGPGEFGQVEMPLARSSASADSDFSRPSMSIALSTLSVFVNWTSR